MNKVTRWAGLPVLHYLLLSDRPRYPIPQESTTRLLQRVEDSIGRIIEAIRKRWTCTQCGDPVKLRCNTWCHMCIDYWRMSMLEDRYLAEEEGVLEILIEGSEKPRRCR